MRYSEGGVMSVCDASQRGDDDRRNHLLAAIKARPVPQHIGTANERGVHLEMELVASMFARLRYVRIVTRIMTQVTKASFYRRRNMVRWCCQMCRTTCAKSSLSRFSPHRNTIAMFCRKCAIHSSSVRCYVAHVSPHLAGIIYFHLGTQPGLSAQAVAVSGRLII